MEKNIFFKARMRSSGFKSSVLFTEATIWHRGCRQEFKDFVSPFGKLSFEADIAPFLGGRNAQASLRH